MSPHIRRGDVLVHCDATRIRVLDHRDRRLITEGVHEPPRGFGVVEVEVRHLLATVLDRGVPPTAATVVAIPRTDLMRVLAVPKVLGTVEREVQRLR